MHSKIIMIPYIVDCLSALSAVYVVEHHIHLLSEISL